MDEQQLETLVKEIKSHTDKGVEKVKTEVTEEVTKIETSVAELKKETDKIEAIKTEVVGIAAKVAGLSEQGTTKILTLKQQIKDAFETNKEAIANVLNNRTGVIELKVVGDITTGSATTPIAAPEIFAQQFAPASNVNLKSTIVDGLVTRFQTSLAAYPYTESLAKDGDALEVAEGVAKPQIDLEVETRFSQAKKAAAWVKLTEEAAKDIIGIQSICETYLRDRVMIKREKLIIADVLAAATAFTGAAAPYAGSIASPTLIDVINTMVTKIFTTHNFTDEMPYKASLALVNPIDFLLQIVSAKDANGLPLYPSASLFNRVQIGGTIIIPYEDAQLAVGDVFVGDLSKMNIADYVGYTVKIGMVNDDFVKNQFVILGEERFHKFIKQLDKVAFLKGTIATIQGNITKEA